MTPILATSKISIFYLVSVAEQAGLNLTLWEAPKTGFVMSRSTLFTREAEVVTMTGKELKTKPALFANVSSRKCKQCRPSRDAA